MSGVDASTTIMVCFVDLLVKIIKDVLATRLSRLARAFGAYKIKGHFMTCSIKLEILQKMSKPHTGSSPGNKSHQWRSGLPWSSQRRAVELIATFCKLTQLIAKYVVMKS